MPKELIHSHQPFSEPKTSDDPTPYVGGAVQVTWGRDQEIVQVATGRVPATGFDSDEAIFTTLNRAGINRLIRVLRTARDQAFGADA